MMTQCLTNDEYADAMSDKRDAACAKNARGELDPIPAGALIWLGSVLLDESGDDGGVSIQCLHAHASEIERSIVASPEGQILKVRTYWIENGTDQRTVVSYFPGSNGMPIDFSTVRYARGELEDACVEAVRVISVWHQGFEKVDSTWIEIRSIHVDELGHAFLPIRRASESAADPAYAHDSLDALWGLLERWQRHCELLWNVQAAQELASIREWRSRLSDITGSVPKSGVLRSV